MNLRMHRENNWKIQSRNKRNHSFTLHLLKRLLNRVYASLSETKGCAWAYDSKLSLWERKMLLCTESQDGKWSFHKTCLHLSLFSVWKRAFQNPLWKPFWNPISVPHDSLVIWLEQKKMPHTKSQPHPFSKQIWYDRYYVYLMCGRGYQEILEVIPALKTSIKYVSFVLVKPKQAINRAILNYLLH